MEQPKGKTNSVSYNNFTDPLIYQFDLFPKSYNLVNFSSNATTPSIHQPSNNILISHLNKIGSINI